MPQRIYYEEPYEQAVREEGERLMDMYDVGSTPYLLGVAILRVLEEKKSAERRLRSVEKQSNTRLHADGAVRTPENDPSQKDTGEGWGPTGNRPAGKA